MGDRIIKDGVLQQNLSEMPHPCRCEFKAMRAAFDALRAEFDEFRGQTDVWGAAKDATPHKVVKGPKVHPNRLNAQQKYAPEMSHDECREYVHHFEGREHNRVTLGIALDMVPDDAQRILYWMDRKDFLKYEKGSGYILAC